MYVCLRGVEVGAFRTCHMPGSTTTSPSSPKSKGKTELSCCLRKE